MELTRDHRIEHRELLDQFPAIPNPFPQTRGQQIVRECVMREVILRHTF
jgi:hypothetical protein